MTRLSLWRFLGSVPPLVLILIAAGEAKAQPPAGRDAKPLPKATGLERARQLERELMDVINRVGRSSVALLNCEALRGSEPSTRREWLLASAGSGVIVRYRGVHVLTAAHVVKGCQRLHAVLADGRHLRLEVRAVDRSADLALLSFVSRPSGLHAASLEDALAEPLWAGRWVVAMGNAFLLALDGRAAATLGVLSGQRPAGLGYGVTTESLQHDAEINPGNSGGPLWSIEGKLLGINGAIVTRSRRQGGSGPTYSGASFSVPVSQVRRFLDAVLAQPATARAGSVLVRGTNGSPTPPAMVEIARRLGITVQPAAVGLLVTSVRSTSPFWGQGSGALHPGDRIVAAGTPARKAPVQHATDLARALRGTQSPSNPLANAPAHPLELDVERGGRRIRLSARAVPIEAVR